MRYFASTGDLTFYEPDRAGTTPVLTISANEYIDVQRLEVADADVRNQVEVWYGARTTRERVYVEDATSMLQHGPLFCRIVEDRSSHIDTEEEAQVMAAAALADMKDPLADQQVTMPLLPCVELNDLHEYVANDDHYPLISSGQ